MDDLIIISDGNEIAYAKTVLDLFRTQVNEETVVRSALGDLYNAELYSKAAFAHAGIPSKTKKVYVGSIDFSKKQWKSVYDKYGMHIDKYENSFCVYVDSKLVGENYRQIFSKLQSLENSFFEKEYKYIKAAGKKKTDFSAENKSLFFLKKTDKERIIQAYRCLSYHLYFDFLSLDSIE